MSATNHHAEDQSLADDERYFRRHGLPLLIEDYSATEDVLTRALPVLTIVFVIQITKGILTSWTPLAAAAIAGGATILVALISVVSNSRRGRRPFTLPERVGWWSAAIFIFIPSLVKLVADDGPVHALRHLVFNTVLCFGVVGVIGWGLIPSLFGALGRVLRDLLVQMSAVIRQMSAVFIFSIIIFINQEVWQLNEQLSTGRFLFLAFVIGGFAILVLLLGTPRLTRLLEQHVPGGDSLTRAQHANLLSLLGIRQAMQVLIMTFFTYLVYVAFGTAVVGADLYDAWQLDPQVSYVFWIGDEPFVITSTLLRTSAMVALLAGLNFSISALTSSEGRAQFLAEAGSEFKTIFERRQDYLTRRAQRSPDTSSTGSAASRGGARGSTMQGT
ncbi:MAG: hypothetical protein E7Z96_04660 [Actinomycetaceae bacterium]|nr:hypothetical protein [Actinomycetaceae bacterium]